MSFNEQFDAATAASPDQTIPGAVVIAADASGNIIHVDAKGQTSVDPEVATPMTADTTFWVASCTKLLTTISALQCVEAGQLDLDEDVSTILPEWKQPEILNGFDDAGEPQLSKATKPITLRQLLTHSSGMGYDFLSPSLRRWREWRGQEIGPNPGNIAEHHLMPLLYEPGQGWAYSCAIDWVGLMVERTNGGIRLGDFMKKHIWEPLGMTSTGFRLAENETIRRNLCATTARTPEGKLVPTAPYPAQNPRDDLGGGGMYSSAKDYVKVLVALLKNDGVLLSPKTVKTMFEPQLHDNRDLAAVVTPTLGSMYRAGVESQAWDFGLGGILNMEDVDGICKKGTMTWGGLPNLFWWIDPSAGTCGMFATQILPPADPAPIALALEFRKYIYALQRG